MARKYSGPSLEEILADLEDAAERSKEKYKEKYAEYSEPSPRHSEAYLLKIVSILIWLASAPAPCLPGGGPVDQNS